jgi:hypothetical protein
MDAGSTPDLFHQLLAKAFMELGVTGPVLHTLLLRDRYLAGHKFRCEGIQAVLRINGSLIEFFDKAGALLKTVNLEPTQERNVA